MKQHIPPFISPQRLKQLLTRVILMMYLNQSTVLLYPTYKNLLEKVRIGLLIQSCMAL